jgi:hypothetical protein
MAAKIRVALATVILACLFASCGGSPTANPSLGVILESSPAISHVVNLLDRSKGLTYEATYTVENTVFQRSSEVVTVTQMPPRLVYSSGETKVYTTSASSDAQLNVTRSTMVTCSASSANPTCQTAPPNSLGILSGAEGFLARETAREELLNIAGGLKSRDPAGLIDSVRSSNMTIAGQHSQCIVAVGTPTSASATICFNSLGVLTSGSTVQLR